MFFINPTKKPTRPQLISGSIWPRERKKTINNKKNFFWRKRKKMEVIPKRREEGKKQFLDFAAKREKNWGLTKRSKLTEDLNFFAYRLVLFPQS